MGYHLGIDIGSTTSKAVLLQDTQVDGTSGVHIVDEQIEVVAVGTAGATRMTETLLGRTGLSVDEMDSIVATGYGREAYPGATHRVSELTAHALGVAHTFPEARTIIDIGGQDAKVIALDDKGRMKNFVMNDKCAAGTGRFLDVMAHILHLDVSEFSEKGLHETEPVRISSTCTVFAESEVISQLATGTELEPIVAGICQSVASRTASLAKRVGVVEPVVMSGGVARNEGVRHWLSTELQVPIQCNDSAQMMGALGAALYGYKKNCCHTGD